MFTARALSQETEAPLDEQGKGKTANLDLYASSAPTRCPTAELPPSDNDQVDDANEESWGAAALQKDGDEPALLETAPFETAPFETAPFETVPLRGHRPRRGSAMPASKEAPLRRLRSEAYWEQRAAAAQWPAGSRWELGVRQRRTCLDEEGGLGPAAAPTPAAEGAAGASPAAAAPPAAGKGAEGGPKSWAGAISRELRRGALMPVPPLAPPLAAPPGPLGAALRSRGWYHLARSC